MLKDITIRRAKMVAERSREVLEVPPHLCMVKHAPCSTCAQRQDSHKEKGNDKRIKSRSDGTHLVVESEADLRVCRSAAHNKLETPVSKTHPLRALIPVSECS